MKLSIKSDTFARKAAKARLKIANNERYIARVNQKVKDISDSEVQNGKAIMSSLAAKREMHAEVNKQSTHMH